MTRMPATETPSLHIDWYKASPDEIKAEIARTRAHMDEHLRQLGRKIRPGAGAKGLGASFAALALAAIGILAIGAFRRRMRARTWSGRMKAGMRGSNVRVKRFRIRSFGALDQIRVLQLAVSMFRKGKPAVYIVEPRRY
jgi:hypothetical protein